ncbi:MAG: hypothetical protein B7Y56_01965 [Gallionellales bacterium 35-53-114]|jgi:MSHA biogenesis protein MshQ|nr:MAG: hypothetical protein B7Y56_01965 [Gallionellales bacterium 35-53-114]OYZ64389.1 MAG: hypothetical protein B7Y04_05745 [Gallionellales bacterium 24-53-125]OZB10303.1 MAG: hypothetical protein B7X61_01960 [Gallionellales bacterium 39-52-133]HQS56903.1 hypothetical protein [Gallionellaceae bacterium]HQS75313.1 hypothetical protein [Gallionellaceae bacterium]
MKNSKIYLGALLLSLLWSGGAQAAVCTSLSAGDWNVIARWSCGRIPLATDTVVIAHNAVRMRNDYTVAGITINAGAVLNDDGNDLTVNGDVVINGQLGNNQGGALRMRTAGASLSGTGTVVDLTIEIDAANITLAAGSTLDFDQNSEIDVGANNAGSLIINGSVTAATQTAGDRVIRVSSGGALTIGTTGVVNAPNSRLELRTNASLLNNGNITVRELRGRSGAPAPVVTQGVNSSLTVSTPSCVAASPCLLNASASGNTVTYNGTSAVILPSAGYWNLAGTIFPGSCPHGVTVLGSDPCPAGGPVSVTRSPSNCVNVGGIGTQAWTNPARAVSSNNSYATRALNDLQVSNYLRCTNYGFAIPAGATIVGISVNVERRASSTNSLRDAAMRLVKDVSGAPAIQATDRSTLTFYPTADTLEAHGGSADLWGDAWAYTDINSTNFGAAFAAQKPGTANGARTVSVDHMPITVTYTMASPLHHIRIEHNGGACSGATAPAEITLKACSDAACTTTYTSANVTGINLSPTGAGYTWSPGNPQSIALASGGINSGITLARNTAGTATLAITGTPSPPPANAYECYNSNTGVSGDCNLVFSTNSFIYTVPDHSAGSRQVLTLRSCKGAFAGETRAVKFWSSYINPATGTLQGNVVAGTGSANCATGYSALGTSSASATTLNLAFGTGTTPQATFSLCYPDVGELKLDTRYDGSAANGDAGVVILGNDTFIAKPGGFTLSNIIRSSDSVANPGAVDASGAIFAKAGEAFTVTVTAQNMLGATTPNYGNETIPESVMLTPALAGGLGLTNNPALSGSFGTFASGVATGVAFMWDEVGIITLTPSVGDASYLGTGNVTGTTSGNVGRFSLGKFGLQNIITDNRADLCQDGVLISDGVTACPAFTYMDEQFDVRFTLAPQSLNDVAVDNYVDSAIAEEDFAKFDPTIFSGLNLAAVDRTTAGGPYYLTARLSNVSMPAVTCATALCFATGSADVTVPMKLSRNVAPDGAYGAVDIGIAPAEADGARVEGAGAAAGLCNNPLVADCYDLDSDATAGNDRALLTTTELRYGRMKVSNAYGSELLPLQLSATAQYYTAGGWLTSTTDNLTNLTLAGTYNLIKDASISGTTTASKTPATGLNAGKLTINLTRPTGAATGIATITPVAPAYLPVIEGRATFGVYKGSNDVFIYQRESY